MFHKVFEPKDVDLKNCTCRYKDKIQVVDQYDANDFAHGENGFPRSLISQIMSAESDELKQMLIKRLTEVKSSDEFKGMSDEEIVKRCVPRNVQTCASLRDFMGHMKDDGLEKALDEYKSKLTNDSVESVPDPSSESSPELKK